MSTEQGQLSSVATPGARLGTQEREGGGRLRLDSVVQTLSERWQLGGLFGVLALSAFLNLWHLTREGYGNSYYAAAVRSMTQSWHNFFFASFDPGGFVTVDKPPVALWIQSAFAKVFGFSGFTILMPQALAGVGAVLLVYLAVSRAFGRTAGLIAGLVLALTPISVAINRSNNLDAWLVFFAAAAAYAVVRAIENGSLRWLLVSALMVGIAFNTKTLAGLVSLPALWAAYLVVAPVALKRRIRDLVAATLVLALVSGAWVAAVDLTPSSSRPYVGGSKTNSEVNLLWEYNGVGRIDGTEGGPGGGNFGAPPRGDFVPPEGAIPNGATMPPNGAELPGGPFTLPQGGRALPQTNGTAPGGTVPGTNDGLPQGAAPSAGGAQVTPGLDGGNATINRADAPRAGGGGPGGSGFGAGQVGPLRLFNAELASQASWLIPLGVFGGFVALLSVGRRLSGNQRLGGIIVFGGWLLVAGAVFSEAKGIFHPYYLSFLGPAIGGMVGIAVVSMWRLVREGRRLALLAPVALAASAAIEVMMLRRTPDYESWLTTAVVAGVVVASIALLVLALRKAPAALATVALTLALGVMLLPPLFWTKSVLASPNNNGTLPYVSPTSAKAGGFDGLRADIPGMPGGAAGAPSMAPGGPGGGVGTTNPALIDYLKANRGDAKFLVAVSSAMEASPIIISTGEPVMAMGGFSGGDPILTAKSLADLVEKGTVRFFLVQGGFGAGQRDDPAAAPRSDQPNQATPDAAPRDAEAVGGPPGFGGRGVTREIQQACKLVDPSAYGGSQTPSTGLGGGGSLYDCLGAADAIRSAGGQ